MLQSLRRVLIREYKEDTHSLSLVPIPNSICISKMNGAMSGTDTCETMKCFNSLYKEELGLYEGYCWNHMRDIWTGGVSNDISIELKQTLDKDLSQIPTILRVSADLKSIIYAVHKEFSLDANYPKGHGKIFRDWYLEAHAGEFLFHTERSNGSRQDIVAIGSMAIYYNRGVYLEFLDERMKLTSATSGDKNILQSCLFIQLGCVELAAAARLFCILYLSMVIPVRWFAAKTHKLSHRTVQGYAWGVRSMGLVADIIYKKYKEIKRNLPSFLMRII